MTTKKSIPWVKNENFIDVTGLTLESFHYTQVFGPRHIDFTLTNNVLGYVLYMKNDKGLSFSTGCTKEQADDFIIDFIKMPSDPEKIDVRMENAATHFAIHAIAHTWGKQEIGNSIPGDTTMHIEFRVNGLPVNFQKTLTEVYEMMEQDIENRAIKLLQEKFTLYNILDKIETGIVQKLESFEDELTNELKKILNQNKEKN